MKKELTLEAWKAFSAKNGFTDKRLHRLIVELDGLAEDDYDARSECLGKIATLATALKKEDTASGKVAVIRYLMEMTTAAQTERRELAKAQLAAEKVTSKEEAEDEEDTDEIWDVAQIVAGSDEGLVFEPAESGRLALRRFNYATRELGEVVYENADWDLSAVELGEDGQP